VVACSYAAMAAMTSDVSEGTKQKKKKPMTMWLLCMFREFDSEFSLYSYRG
jgi:hypothetical protein